IGEEFLYADGSRIDLGGDYISDLPGQKLILETPKGGTYQVVLSDGTTVWLNANSQLIYPSTYAANLRQVEVQGEAYFDVKPQYSSEGNLVPFQVLTKTHTVTVLGTAFNVSSYESQDLHKTTLVSGKVRVEHAGRDYELIPGDQAVISPSSASIQQVQTAPYIAWKD